MTAEEARNIREHVNVMAEEIGSRCWVDLMTAEQREMIERHARAVMLDYLLFGYKEGDVERE